MKGWDGHSLLQAPDGWDGGGGSSSDMSLTRTFASQFRRGEMRAETLVGHTLASQSSEGASWISG